MAQTKRFISIILPSLLYTFVSAQGYGDAPDPEPPKVTTAPILIDWLVISKKCPNKIIFF